MTKNRGRTEFERTAISVEYLLKKEEIAGKVFPISHKAKLKTV